MWVLVICAKVELFLSNPFAVDRTFLRFLRYEISVVRVMLLVRDFVGFGAPYLEVAYGFVAENRQGGDSTLLYR